MEEEATPECVRVQKEHRRRAKTREDPKGARKTKGARMIVRKAPLILLRFKGGWGVPLDVGLVLPLPSLSEFVFRLVSTQCYLSLLRLAVCFWCLGTYKSGFNKKSTGSSMSAPCRRRDREDEGGVGPDVRATQHELLSWRPSRGASEARWT